MNPKWEEQILVVKRDKLFNDEKLAFQGVIVRDADNHAKGEQIILNLNEYYEIMRRGNANDPTPPERNAEINYSYKQPIPYCLIRRGNQIFVYERLAGGGEQRLQNKLSIGAGGHMNDLSYEDKYQLGIDRASVYTLLTDNLERELNEELDISDNERQAEIFGLINDDSDEVGKVHIGILVIIDVNEDCEIEVLEEDQLFGYWLTLEELLAKETYDRLENWSKIAVDALK